MASTTELEALYDELGSYLEDQDTLNRSTAAVRNQKLASDIFLPIEMSQRSSHIVTGEAAKELRVWDPNLQRRLRIKSAQIFLARRYRKIHSAICGDAEQRQKILQCDEASVVTVLADCLAPFFTGVPMFTVANLIARVGIKRLCQGNPFTQKSIKQASSSASEDSSSAI